jgi:hypothetical protein
MVLIFGWICSSRAESEIGSWICGLLVIFVECLLLMAE